MTNLSSLEILSQSSPTIAQIDAELARRAEFRERGLSEDTIE